MDKKGQDTMCEDIRHRTPIGVALKCGHACCHGTGTPVTFDIEVIDEIAAAVHAASVGFAAAWEKARKAVAESGAKVDWTEIDSDIVDNGLSLGEIEESLKLFRAAAGLPEDTKVKTTSSQEVDRD